MVLKNTSTMDINAGKELAAKERLREMFERDTKEISTCFALIRLFDELATERTEAKQ